MNTERRNAFLEAAAMCEAEILPPGKDPPTTAEAAAVRSTCEAVMRMMARRFRAEAECVMSATDARSAPGQDEP